ncbi:uncharacterized protein PG986_005667 [Apiospora aurea]|uniref:2EXR domain-containing protein n=1 Tax=Apiospora aurea TaxID=335848 RepID=A0ABR1QI87_9PEZI
MVRHILAWGCEEARGGNVVALALQIPDRTPPRDLSDSITDTMPSPESDRAAEIGSTTVVIRPKAPRNLDTLTIPEKRVAKRTADGTVKALLGNTSSFPLFNKLPPELRILIWKMAAEQGQCLEMGQMCRCTSNPGAVHFKVDMELLKRRLALLHACREARLVLAPRYDAFEYKRSRQGLAKNNSREGFVEAPGDLYLRPSRLGAGDAKQNEDKPELTWKFDHSYVPGDLSWRYNQHPHMLVDCQQDTFKGRLSWAGIPYCAAKRDVVQCALKRPEEPLPGRHSANGIWKN